MHKEGSVGRNCQVILHANFHMWKVLEAPIIEEELVSVCGSRSGKSNESNLGWTYR